jgi:hypothetical protein
VVHRDRMLGGTHRLEAGWYQETGDCVVPKIGGWVVLIGWVVPRGRRLGGAKNRRLGVTKKYEARWYS